MMSKRALGAAIIAAALFCGPAANQSRADVLDVTFWNGSPAGGILSKNLADLPVPTGAPTATFTYTGDLSWVDIEPQNNTPAGNLVKNFLTLANISNFTSTTFANSILAFGDSSLSIAGDAYVSFFKILGSYNEPAPQLVSLTHDDGASVYIDGNPVLVSPGETVAITQQFIAPAGAHDYAIYYVSANGAPSVLVLTTAVPELSTWAMMLIGFAGLGFMAYRRKQRMLAVS